MTACPTVDRLELHLAGELSDGSGGRVAEHIETCSTCRRELQEVKANESFLAKIRRSRGSRIFSAGSQTGSECKTRHQPGPGTARLAGVSGPDLVDLVRDGAGALIKAGVGGSGLPQVPDPTTIPSIPDYELLYICGRGAFGKVWIVRDRAGVFRAMKIIEFDRAASLGIPHREMRALENYCRNVPAHQNLVQIFHIGEDAHRLYYTMELADNLWSRKPVRKEVPPEYQPMTLQAIMDVRQLGVDTAIEIILRLLKGLGRLHDAGLVHRDIKPANIIFVGRQVKLADVSLVTTKATHLSTVGTPSYMPPDECMDATADTYAIGKVLYEMLTQRDLTHFPRLSQNREFNSSFWDPTKLDALLIQACSSNARERFATADAMSKALHACRTRPYDSLLVDLAEHEDAVGQKMSPSHETLWKLLDYGVRLVPWGVILILGIYAIRQLS